MTTSKGIKLTENIFPFLLQFSFNHLLGPDAAGLCGEVDKHWNIVALVGDAHQQALSYH